MTPTARLQLLAIVTLAAALSPVTAAAQQPLTTRETFDAVRRDAAMQQIDSLSAFHKIAERHGMTPDGTQRLLRDAAGVTGAAFSPGTPSVRRAITRTWHYPQPYAALAPAILEALIAQAAEFYVEDSRTVRVYLKRSPFIQCDVVDSYLIEMASGSVVEFDSTVTCAAG